MTTYAVDLDGLSLIAQVADRQAGHVTTARTHIDTFTNFSGGGLVMAAFGGPVTEGRSHALTGLEDAREICEAVGTMVGKNREAYLAAEEEAHTLLAAPAADAGVELGPFPDPGPEPTLAPAGKSGTPICYAGPESDPYEKIPEQAWKFGTKTVTTYTGPLANQQVRDDLEALSVLDKSKVSYWKDELGKKVMDEIAERRGWTPDPAHPDESWSQERARLTETNGRTAYDNGRSTSPIPQGPALPNGQGPNDWSTGNYSGRGVNVVNDVVEVADGVKSAWEGLQGAADAADARDFVNDTANATSNTSNSDWADR